MGILNWLRRNLLYDRDEDYFPDCQLFLDDRDALLEAFHQAAIAAGKPRGLRWVSVTSEGEPVFAVNQLDDLLFAFWPVTVMFEPLAGSGMEDVPQATGPRGVLATFAFRRGRWQTVGHAIFNHTVEQINQDNWWQRIDFNPHRTA